MARGYIALRASPGLNYYQHSPLFGGPWCFLKVENCCQYLYW